MTKSHSIINYIRCKDRYFAQNSSDKKVSFKFWKQLHLVILLVIQVAPKSAYKNWSQSQYHSNSLWNIFINRHLHSPEHSKMFFTFWSESGLATSIHHQSGFAFANKLCNQELVQCYSSCMLFPMFWLVYFVIVICCELSVLLLQHWVKKNHHVESSYI